MNSVLDILKLRRIRLDYVSPPVCPTMFSSGSSFSGSCFLELGSGFSECDALGPAPLRILGPATGFCAGTPYLSQFTVIGAIAPCVWELISGAFPPGMIFSSGPQPGNTAALTGTPSVGGDYSYTVRCVDSTSGAQGDLTGVLSGIQILEASALPSATTDTAYSEQLHATGGASPFSFSSGSLPSGLSLSSGGLLSGIPRYDGTYDFTVTVIDSEGAFCYVPMALAIGACPVVSTYPTIAQWGSAGDGHHGPQEHLIHGAFDQARRIWWIPQSKNFISDGAPYQVVSLIDTQSVSLAGYATDTLGLITGQAQGDTGNGLGIPAIDTKYNQCVVCGNQGYYAWYDLDSKNCLAVTHILSPPHNLKQLLHNTVAYDRFRGYVYMTFPLGMQISVTVLDCNPSVRNAIGDYTDASQAGGTGAYCPTTDLVYIVNPSGNHIYSTWDPNTNAFSLNVAAAPLGTGINIEYLPGLDLLAVDTGADVLFVDPATHTQVGHAPTLTAFSNMVYNSCNNMIYASSSVFGGIIRCDPASGFSTTNLLSVFPGTTYLALAFDRDGSRIFTGRVDNWTVETGV